MYKAIFVLFALLVFGVTAKTVYDTKLVVSEIIRVYDGDTFFCNLSGVLPIFGDTVGIRLVGIQTPEIEGSVACEKLDAIKARDYLNSRLRNGCKIVLTNLSRDKYFRIDAVVYVDSVNINQEMIQKCLAVPYDGVSKKPAWVCQQN